MEVFIPDCYGIIGNGRMAKHFTHYLTLLGISYQQWSRDKPRNSLITLAETCSPILLLINDDAIELFIEQHHCLQKKLLLHFSAVLNLKKAYSTHPLMSFFQELYSLDVYKKIPFIYGEKSPEFSLLLPGLPNPHFKIPENLKSFYHALCVLSGNFTVILWQKFFCELEETLNIPKEQAYPFLQQITQNLLADQKNALTGPLVRNDIKTIEAHLIALKNDPFQEIYQTFLKVFSQTRLKI
jgi:2-dehydropantoate 2-reductase